MTENAALSVIANCTIRNQTAAMLHTKQLGNMVSKEVLTNAIETKETPVR
jgi:hypothetical protein